MSYAAYVEATISDAQRWRRISLLALLICSDRKSIEEVDKDYPPSNARRLAVPPGNGMMTISTCSPTAKLSGASSRPMQRLIARQPTATPQAARTPWLRSLRAGGGYDKPPAACGENMTVTRLVALAALSRALDAPNTISLVHSQIAWHT
jgi:hypothetical protein